MKYIIITLTIIIALIFAFSLNASEQKEITITDEAMTIHYEWETTATASVMPNKCNTCVLNHKKDPKAYCEYICNGALLID